MGHYRSDFTSEPTTKFCGMKYPHIRHQTISGTYDSQFCDGFTPEVARPYVSANYYTSSGLDYFACPDCGAAIIEEKYYDEWKNRKIHDTFHDKMDRAGVIPVFGMID